MGAAVAALGTGAQAGRKYLAGHTRAAGSVGNEGGGRREGERKRALPPAAAKLQASVARQWLRFDQNRKCS